MVNFMKSVGVVLVKTMPLEYILAVAASDMSLNS